MTPAQKESFISLACALSPENLSCDGERSATEQKAALAAIRRDWKLLETAAGQTVSVDDAERWAFGGH